MKHLFAKLAILSCLASSALADEDTPARNPYFEKVARAERERRQAERDSQQLDLRRSADGSPLLRKVVDQFDRYHSITANLRQKVNLFGHQLCGTGRYLQQGRGEERMLRMELRMEVADQVANLQQICDGKHLWTHQDLLGQTSLWRVDLQAVRLRLDQDPELSHTLSPSAWVAFGGIPRLLDAMESSFRFDQAREAVLADPQRDIPVWVMQGEWTPARLMAMLPNQKAAIEAGDAPDYSQLPPQIPDRVVLTIGREDLFPYRIQYLRRVWPDKKKSDQFEDQTLVELETYLVQFNVAIRPDEFRYAVGDQDFADRTQEYLKELGFRDPPPKP